MDTEIRSLDDLLIDDILEREGSTFTDDPADRGGATKYGITQRSWDEYCKRFISKLPHVASVRDLDEPRAREFYKWMYVQPLAWIEDIELRELVLDCAVNHGATRATKWLQRAAGCLAIDGVIGPETRELVNATKYDSGGAERKIAQTYALVLIARFKFYAQIATDQRNLPGGDPDAKFLAGWINRACEFIR